jgi:hypothetical protein
MLAPVAHAAFAVRTFEVSTISADCDAVHRNERQESCGLLGFFPSVWRILERRTSPKIVGLYLKLGNKSIRPPLACILMRNLKMHSVFGLFLSAGFTDLQGALPKVQVGLAY